MYRHEKILYNLTGGGTTPYQAKEVSYPRPVFKKNPSWYVPLKGGFAVRGMRAALSKVSFAVIRRIVIGKMRVTIRVPPAYRKKIRVYSGAYRYAGLHPVPLHKRNYPICSG